MTVLSEHDRMTIAAVLRAHAELQDGQALMGTAVLARLRLAEPSNPLTIAMEDSLQDIEVDCANLLRLAALMEGNDVP